MSKRNRLFVLLPVLLLCAALPAACGEKEGGGNTASEASVPDEAVTDTTQQDAEAGAADTEEERVVPEIESRDLTGFMMAFGDPEQTDPAASSLPHADLLNGASFTFTIKTADTADKTGKVTCTVAAKPYDTPEEAEAQHVTFSADYADLQALQTLVEKEELVQAYCDFDDKEDPAREWEYAKLTLLYASGESAYHYCNTACDFTASHRSAVLAFFYDLLDKYDMAFYAHALAFEDEESFIEAFMGQAPWDALPVTLADGTEATLLLTSDPTGRVFRLEAGEDVYAGNYKLKKKEDDGRWRLDLTLTKWPAAYVPMTKGGSILIDTEAVAPDGSSPGLETLVVSKYPNTASVFDPFYGDSAGLVFTRNWTTYFEEKPSALNANAEEGATE